ncbi:MAG: helix-turn-helix transcriptional regulator [Sedimentitalea sp.]|uniref:helix-turn-helix domain-containing protein n=1 Tax=Sedimentitalea sp. TaxID=2048915 RepID=UPI003265DD09
MSVENIISIISEDRPDVQEYLKKTEDKRSLALSLWTIRKHARLTQAELAEKMHVKQSAISKLESASGSLPNLETVHRFAKACGVRVFISFVAEEADAPDLENEHESDVSDNETDSGGWELTSGRLAHIEGDSFYIAADAEDEDQGGSQQGEWEDILKVPGVFAYSEERGVFAQKAETLRDSLSIAAAAVKKHRGLIEGLDEGSKYDEGLKDVEDPKDFVFDAELIIATAKV